VELIGGLPCPVSFSESEGLLIALFGNETEAVVYDATHCTLAVVEILQPGASSGVTQ
jgi:hypothetical protein